MCAPKVFAQEKPPLPAQETTVESLLTNAGTLSIVRIGEDTGKVSVTDEFGDCGDSPTITLQLIPDEQVTLRFQGYYPLRETEEPGFKPPPPSTWVYKRGVLKQLNPAPTPKRRGK